MTAFTTAGMMPISLGVGTKDEITGVIEEHLRDCVPRLER